MAKKYCLVSFSTPGKWNRSLIDEVRSIFEDCDIEMHQCDTMPSWGNLNQNWIEGRMDVDTSWSWCRPLCLNDHRWDWLWNKLENGELLMMVSYITKDGFEAHC